jgi:hypothetical protein
MEACVANQVPATPATAFSPVETSVVPALQVEHRSRSVGLLVLPRGRTISVSLLEIPDSEPEWNRDANQ